MLDFARRRVLTFVNRRSARIDPGPRERRLDPRLCRAHYPEG